MVNMHGIETHPCGRTFHRAPSQEGNLLLPISYANGWVEEAVDGGEAEVHFGGDLALAEAVGSVELGLLAELLALGVGVAAQVLVLVAVACETEVQVAVLFAKV